MANVLSQAQKSRIQPKHDAPGGVDIDFGERIIFEYNDMTYLGLCQGWRLDGKQALIKTDMYNEMAFRVDVPIEKVWRVRDARDDRIEQLEGLVDHWMEKFKDARDYAQQYKTLYESLSENK